jgi:hypothetical protein
VPGVVKRVTGEKPRRIAEINPQLSPSFEEVVQLQKNTPRRSTVKG